MMSRLVSILLLTASLVSAAFPLSPGQRRRAKRREHWERHKAQPNTRLPGDHLRSLLQLETEESLRSPPRSMAKGTRVLVQVGRSSPLGLNCIVLGSHLPCLAYHDEAKYHTELPVPGDVLAAHVLKERARGEIDISFRPVGAVARMEDAATVVLRALFDAAASGGPARLPLGDKSNPTDIYAALALSKASFKAALGRLLKMDLLIAPLQPETVELKPGATWPDALTEHAPMEQPAPLLVEGLPRWLFEETRDPYDVGAGYGETARPSINGGGGGRGAEPGAPPLSLLAAGALVRLLEQCGEVAALRDLVDAFGEPTGRCRVHMARPEGTAAAHEALEAEGMRVRSKVTRLGGEKSAAPPAAAPLQATRLFVGNLHPSATEDDLWDVFIDCGYIDKVSVQLGEDGGCKGFGHVQFGDGEGVQRALQLAGHSLHGQRIRVEPAQERPPRPARRPQYADREQANGRGDRPGSARRPSGRGGRDSGNRWLR